MSVALLKDGETWTLRLAGIVNVSEADPLHAAAREAARGAPRIVVVECAGLEALESGGDRRRSPSGACAAPGRGPVAPSRA